MPDYTFNQLSPRDFEQLSRDLLQARDSLFLESFKTGRDLGIDFRYSSAGQNTIAQCKHFTGSSFPKLAAALKKEVPKVKRLKPKRYILVTSLGLTPTNKDNIQKLFGKILSLTDIMGADDINNLLGLHPDVERRHYKLWLSSRTVLDKLIHNAVAVQSEFDIARIYRDIGRYVQSAAYPRALEMLEASHIAIISGAPGVGKTTLAKMLIYTHLAQDYEVVSILSDFHAGREKYQPGKRQIFYFDDFIGVTFLGERAPSFTRNEDRSILDFIELVNSSPTSRLIATTREHILRQAIGESEKLRQSRLIDDRYILEVGDYSRQQRAEILFNHIYFSDLPTEHRETLLANNLYKDIIDHPKFNPRLIDWLSNYQRIKRIEFDDYTDFIHNLLANPFEIWRYAYDKQISDAARSILLVLRTFNGRCHSDILERAFWSTHQYRAKKYGYKADPSDWRRTISELHDSFIRAEHEIRVIDPSILDMLNTVLQEDLLNLLDLIDSALHSSQLRHIWLFVRALNRPKIIDLLSTEDIRFSATIARLLIPPPGESASHWHSDSEDSLESCLSIALDIAESLKSETVRDTIVANISRSFDQKSGNHDLADGISLLQQIEESKFVFPTPDRNLRTQILHSLAITASDGCGSDDLVDLLNLIGKNEETPRIHEYLATAAEIYRTVSFTAELHTCQSAKDYAELQTLLISISERTGVNLEGPIYVTGVEAEQAEEEEEESYRRIQSRSTWEREEELDGEANTGDRSIEDMFGSLGKQGAG